MKLVAIFSVLLFVFSPVSPAIGQLSSQPVLSQRSVTILTVDGLHFKDLNKNSKLDRYEDWRLAPEARAEDLLEQMTLDEMAGLLVHGTLATVGASVGRGTGGYDESKVRAFIGDAHINSFITRLSGTAEFLANQNNRIQELAESTRLGVPVTISTDPRNHFEYIAGASVQAGSFSKWPELLGFAAAGDENLVRSFADIARQEYLAVGIRETLSPQADLATDPRWPRINGTFGEDAETARRLLRAYVEGFQAGKSGPNPSSVLAIVKHWVGYGAQKDGWDSHNYYGRFADFPGNNFAYHVIPFTGAFDANVAGVMPTYSILQHVSIDGAPLEQVGAGFNAQLLTGLLRSKYKFKGVVVSDWAITNDCTGYCRDGFPPGQKPDFSQLGMSWGVEGLSREDRFAKAINAGVDQLGGTEEANLIVGAVHDGKLKKSRVQEAASRILIQKFQTGLFENPYVDASRAKEIVGNARFATQAEQAQRRSLVLLENKKGILPIEPAGKRVFLHGIDPSAAAEAGFTVVDSPEKADIAVIRANAPFESEHPGYTFGRIQHEGRLDFRESDPAYAALVKASAIVPTVVTVNLDRPAILTNVKDKAAALIGNFGVNDRVLLEVICGHGRPEGHLPFELPSSVEAVRSQKGDVPHDSENPLYRFGYGLSY